VRRSPCKSSVVQKSQSQQTQSSWACAGLRTFEHDQLAVFCLSGQRRDRCDSSSERSIAENSGIEGDKDTSEDLNETSDSNNENNSTSPYQETSATNRPDSSDKDRSQDQSNTNSDGIDNQNVEADHSPNGQDDSGDDSHGETANDAKINKLIGKIEKSIKAREDNLEKYTSSWNQNFWAGVDFKTPAQWSFDSLVDSAENDPFRAVLHRLSLHRNLEERIRQNARQGQTHMKHKRQCKDDMMEESPLFCALDSQRQDSRRRMFDIYVRQGAIFDEIGTLCPGLIGLVAPILTFSEYVWYLLMWAC